MYVHIRAYTCIYDLWNHTGSLIFCTYVRAYMHVFARICVRICTYMQVCTIIRTSMRLTTFRTNNTYIYVQYVHIRANTSQHTYNIRAYTYFIFAQIRAHTSDRMCTYMHVYASICMYVARMTYVYVCELYVYASMSKYVHVCNVCNYVFASMCWGAPLGYDT